MIPAIVIGRKGSTGFKGKNTALLAGKPLSFYPISAALRSQLVDEVYVSTDDEKISNIALDLGAQTIVRPQELATDTALGEHVFVHAYKSIKHHFNNIEMVVLLFCNSPTISGEIIDDCILQLRNSPDADSIVTCSRYNMWSPLRARKVGSDGYLQPFVPFEVFGDPSTLNCDRDSQGDVLFANMSASIVRPHCLDYLDDGLLPQKWMGTKILPYHQVCGLDVDYPWQMPMAEWWINNA